MNISRRQFLGSSALALCIPSVLFAQDKNADVVLRFAACSDVHFDQSHNEKSAQRVRFAKMMQFMNAYSASQPYDRFDALAVAGDFSNHGLISEIGPFRQSMDENLKPETKRVLCMGNHEYYGGNRELWEKTFETPANNHQVINGFHFITISPERGTCAENDYVYALDWFKKELAAACADDPKRPVFVVQHYHVHSTVWGSWNLPGAFPAGVHDLKETIEQYPQVVHISGHSHAPSIDPRVMWQGNFNAIGTGSLSYYGLYYYDEVNDYHHEMLQPHQAGTFLIFEVHRDFTIRIRLYDVISDSFHDREYLIVDPSNIEKYVYTNKRLDLAKEPFWPAEKKAEVLETTENGAVLEFTQAGDAECLTCYRVDLERLQEKENQWVPDCTEFIWSDFFMKNPAPICKGKVGCLRSGTKYRAKVFAQNAFCKTTANFLEVEFETKPAPASIDRTGMKPKADFLDVSFSKDGAKNDPADPRYTSEVKTFGNPQFLDASVKLDGKEDAFHVPVKSGNYQALRAEVTIGTKFRLNLPEDRKETVCIFGNTESGGLGFEYAPQKKTLLFIVFFAGKYERVEVPYDVAAGGEITLFGTYDGVNMNLYVNGELAGSKPQKGRVRYTKTKPAQAFCIGGDVTHEGKTRLYVPGEISWAKVYSWALTPEQVASFQKND
ncbi:MAG: metallophosphoesterase [Thermoguttaceae bacterium]|nr:metallophosphoesterase [Thermoguttaceae bacterium]